MEDQEERALDDVGVPDEDELDDELIATGDIDLDDLEQGLERQL
jgi:hypothetical protein